MFCKINNLVIEHVRSSGIGQQPQNAWEDLVIQNWNLSGMSLVQTSPNLRDLARWDCPLMDWYKINFDGASKGNPGIASCGIIIRNVNGDRMGGMAIPIGIQTNHVVEANANLYGLIYAKRLNLNKLWLDFSKIPWIL